MPPPDAHPDRTRVRRRFAFALIGLTVVILLLITPPLVNVDRYRHRIVQTVSDSLGRPVHIDDVKLHLLPLPSLELRNVVVSEDPAFGAEPTIRANRVEAILRPSSLWRRRIEFSTIRFTTDENGSGPSVNLVRNAAGRWNLDSVLMQAAHTATAPTDQRQAGPAPRFPYIEATSARVNLKLGEEKMPFSLTDTDFALWLPSPGHWRVRLRGRPTRTDASLSETGTVRVEGTLERAASMGKVPADLHATWTGAQLGEATALLTGQDMGWRGTGTLDVVLRGPLGDAQLTSTLQLEDLRRSEFVPARMLDLTVTCQAQAAVTDATLQAPQCNLPAPLPGGENRSSATLGSTPGSTLGGIQLQAAQFDLTSRTATGLRFGVQASAAWLLDWARLLSPAIPPEENPVGGVEGTLTQVPAAARQPAFWTGTLQGSLSGVPPGHQPDDAASHYDFAVTGSPSGLDLAPVNLAAASEPPLALSGNANPNGYTLRLLGQAAPEHVLELAGKLPPLDTGLSTVLSPPLSPHPTTPTRLDLTCSRPWSAPAQTCVLTHPVEPTVRTRHR